LHFRAVTTGQVGLPAIECDKSSLFASHRARLPVNLSLLVQLCGWPLIIGLVLTEVSLLVIVGYLVFVAKRENLLQAFFPLTGLPIAMGLVGTFLGFVSGIGMQVDENEAIGLDPIFLLQMNLIPLFASCIAAMPAAVLCSGFRFQKAWQSSGLRLIAEKPAESMEEDEGISDRKRLERDADDYLDRLVRSR
jgi:hypothetical protein